MLSNRISWENDLEGVLGQAVTQVKAQPIPKRHAQQVLDRIEQWPQPRRIVLQNRRRFLALSGIAASILFFFAWLAWPGDSWAQVVQAMQQKPWIRMSSTILGTSSVHWISLPREIIAWRGRDAVFQDSRLKVIYRYDEAEKTIYRLPEDPSSRNTALATQNLFTSILQNKNKLSGSIQERMEVLDQERRDITRDGRQMIEYELMCRVKDQHDARLTMTFQVDPVTHLAQKLIYRNLTPRSKDEPLELEFEIDYPDQGPLDIYDLGVAKTSKYIDRIPPDDLQRIDNSIKTNRESFDAYAGIVVTGKMPFVRIWRKGTKWRIETCRSAQLSPPADPAEQAKWWLAQTKDMIGRAIEVCDGKYIYTPDHKNYLPNEASIDHSVSRSVSFTNGVPEMESGQARLFLPELIGYAIVPVGSQHYSVITMAHQEKGLEGTTLLHARLTQVPPGGAARLQRYWIDPLHGYIVLRHDIAEWDGLPDYLVTRSIEKMNRTPSGIWYPEVIKGSNSNFQFYLDFTTPLPEELFTPKERPMKK